MFFRQNKIKKSKDRHRRRMSLTSDGQLGDTCKIQNYRKFDSILTKSCPDIVIGNTDLKRGVRMDPVEANKKSELMREVVFSSYDKVFLSSLRLNSQLFVYYVVVCVLNLIVIWILRFHLLIVLKRQVCWFVM